MEKKQKRAFVLDRRELDALDVADLLKLAKIEVDPGLDEDELRGIEHEYGFRFSPSHAVMLRRALPVERKASQRRDEYYWPDWRGTSRVVMERRLAEPKECVVACVEDCAMWLPDLWGPRPSELAAATGLVREFLSGVPRLIPVHSHRWLPEDCGIGDPPVISLTTMAPFDPIFIGTTLTEYVAEHFGLTRRTGFDANSVVHVPFWSDFIDWAERHVHGLATSGSTAAADARSRNDPQTRHWHAYGTQERAMQDPAYRALRSKDNPEYHPDEEADLAESLDASVDEDSVDMTDYFLRRKQQAADPPGSQEA